jgi:N,N'-diacetyllegionaminate synthase
VRIADRVISEQSEPYVIAELGVNHDGSVDRAIAMVDAAADAGADAIKLQLFRAEMLMSRASRLAGYQQQAGETDPLEMLRRLELRVSQMGPVVQRALVRGVHAIVTCFSVELVDEAMRLPWHALKTASPDIIHRPLLDALIATGRPMIVSTGAATMGEVLRAVEWLAPAHDRLCVLQCVSSYPTPIDRAELGGIIALGQALDVPVGYSDHTSVPETAMDAVASGACVLEKHLTLDKRATGPDHAASLDPGEFRRYVELARLAYRLCREPGDPRHAEIVARRASPPHEKRLSELERDVRAVSRQSIVTVRDLPAGSTLTRADVTFKRPGTGIEPWRVGEIVGRVVTRDVQADMPLAEADVGQPV